MPQQRLKIPCATTKTGRSKKKKKKKIPNSTAVLLLPAWLLLRLVFIWDSDNLSFNSQLHCPPSVFCHFPIFPIAPASMCVLLPFVNPDEKFSLLPVSAIAMLEARKNLLEAWGPGGQSHQNCHITNLSPYCPSQSFPRETYLVPLEYAE